MEVSIFQLILTVLYGFFINFEKNSTMLRAYQPVTAGFVTGLILGDISTGLFIGGTLQLLSLGISNFGGASIPDYQIASIVVTFIIITTGQKPSVEISIGIPVALLMVQLDVIRNIVGIWMVHKAKAGVKKDDYSMTTRIQMFGVFLTAATTGIPVALAVTFSPSLISMILPYTPEWLTNGLTVAGGLLSVVDIGLLLQYLPVKEYFSYLVIGFVMAVYMEIPLLGVALVGAAVALIIYKKSSQDLVENTAINIAGGMDDDG